MKTLLVQLKQPQIIRAFTYLLILVSIVVVGSILVTNWQLIQSHQWELNLSWLAIGIFLLVLLFLLSGSIWHWIVNRLTGFDNLLNNLQFWAYANLSKRLPTPIWYMGNRAILYEKWGIRKLKILLASSLELVLIIVSGTIILLLSLPFSTTQLELPFLANKVWTVPVVVCCCIGIVHPKSVTFLLSRLGHSSIPRRVTWKNILGWTLAYSGIWLLGSGVLYCFINLLYRLPFHQMPIIVTIWTISNLIAAATALIAINIGFREVSITVLLNYLVPVHVALLTAIILRVAWMGIEIISSILVMKQVHKHMLRQVNENLS